MYHFQLLNDNKQSRDNKQKDLKLESKPFINRISKYNKEIWSQITITISQLILISYVNVLFDNNILLVLFLFVLLLIRVVLLVIFLLFLLSSLFLSSLDLSVWLL